MKLPPTTVFLSNVGGWITIHTFNEYDRFNYAAIREYFYHMDTGNFWRMDGKQFPVNKASRWPDAFPLEIPGED